jgi:glutaredoxin/pyruvate-formate lyase-activating enzyme
MTTTIYSATGCARCNITKKYMKENSIGYEEFDIKAEGKDDFSKFYRENRKDIFRDKDGVEFPVFTDGKVIRQGVSVVLGYLIAADALQGFIGRSVLHGEWLDGIDISGGDPKHTEKLVQVLRYLKKSGLKIQAVNSGRNSQVLETVLQEGLADRLIMDVKGPAALYQNISGLPIEDDELKRSIRLATTAPEYSFYTTIVPVVRSEETVEYLSPEEVGATAQLIEEASGNKKNPYTLCSFDPKTSGDERLSSLEPLPSSALFKYRTAARRYQVMTDIAK